LFEGIEIAVGVQQRVFVLDAVAGEQNIDRAMNSDAGGAQRAIVLRRPQHFVFAADRHHGQSSKRAARGLKVLLMPETTQHFEQHEIGHAERRAAVGEEIGQSLDRIARTAVKEADPDRGVDQDHDLRLVA
jgi:hypothetical protein